MIKLGVHGIETLAMPLHMRLLPVSTQRDRPVPKHEPASGSSHHCHLPHLLPLDANSYCSCCELHIVIATQLCMLSAKSRLTLRNLQTVACQVPLFVGLSRQECWKGLPLPYPGDLPDPGMELGSPALQSDSLPSELATKITCKDYNVMDNSCLS